MNNKESEGVERGRLAVFETIPCESGVSKQGAHGLKRPHSPDSEHTNFSDDEDDYIDNSIRPSNKPKIRGIRLVEEPLSLQCKWNNCQLDPFDDFHLFTKHVQKHVQDYGPGRWFECKWENCAYITELGHLFEQHLSHHCYHDKVRNIGKNMELRNVLPECNPMNVYEIPENPQGYCCDWDDCDTTFWDINKFFYHTFVHASNNPKYCKKGEVIACDWRGCSYKFSTQYKLRDHIRSHTKEKVVACFTCGQMFSTKTKFCDHRQRQLALHKQSYKCSQCSRVFPTERILRDHMRSHINHYKCNMCDMTCPKPSALVTHIRYRHMDERPFKCNVCEYATINKQALEQHLMTHCPENLFTCEECRFSCRSLYGLDCHYQKAHGLSAQVYECHCCQSQFSRGNFLTKHLIQQHDFHWPSGHSRFRYKEDNDGIYRLQTVRYETIEVTQEMIQEPSKVSKK